jgi:hypothetical protein
MPSKIITINVIEVLREMTIDNERFNGAQWCLADAIVLEKAARLIRNELPKKYIVDFNSCRCHPETCCCKDWAIWEGSKKVETFTEKFFADRVCELMNEKEQTKT